MDLTRPAGQDLYLTQLPSYEYRDLVFLVMIVRSRTTSGHLARLSDLLADFTRGSHSAWVSRSPRDPEIESRFFRFLRSSPATLLKMLSIDLWINNVSNDRIRVHLSLMSQEYSSLANESLAKIYLKCTLSRATSSRPLYRRTINTIPSCPIFFFFSLSLFLPIIPPGNHTNRKLLIS